MAYGEHWEWRGFGGVRPRFAKRFLLLPQYYESHEVRDHYLWMPGLNINAKFRKGRDEGLKFKRLIKKEGDFEVWVEDEEELYEFPLDEEAWQSLFEMLQEVDIELPPYPSAPPDRETSSQILKEAGCRFLTVVKERETRLLEQPEGPVLLEWTAIKEPQLCTSIGIEAWSEDNTADLSGDQALETIKAALPTLNLHNEPLQPMNYLEAVKHWSEGNKI